MDFYGRQPYRPTEMSKRWFNQYALCLLANGKVVELNVANPQAELSKPNPLLRVIYKEHPEAEGVLIGPQHADFADLFRYFGSPRESISAEIQLRQMEETKYEKEQALYEAEENIREESRAAFRQALLNAYDEHGPLEFDLNEDEYAEWDKPEEWFDAESQSDLIAMELRKKKYYLDKAKEVSEEADKRIAELREEIDTLQESIEEQHDVVLQRKAHLKQLVKCCHIEINQDAVAERYGSAIDKVVHRPNHGFMHSMRVASYVPVIYGFLKKYNDIPELSDNELLKLQLMMLFSVVGRQDEVGFFDGGDPLGNAQYRHYRYVSARTFLDYCQKHMNEPGHLYANERALYTDALIVELMGRPDMVRLSQIAVPEILIDWVVLDGKDRFAPGLTEKERRAKASREIQMGLHDDFFNHAYHLAKAKKRMMYECHGRDLQRCYPLYKHGQHKNPSVVAQFLESFDVMKFCNRQPHEYHLFEFVGNSWEKLTDLYDLLDYSQQLLTSTGNKVTHQLISREEFDKAETRERVLGKLQELAALCRAAVQGNPQSLEQIRAMLTEDGEAEWQPFTVKLPLSIDGFQAGLSEQYRRELFRYFEYKVQLIVANSFYPDAAKPLEEQVSPKYDSAAFACVAQAEERQHHPLQRVLAIQGGLRLPDFCDEMPKPVVDYCLYDETDNITLVFHSEVMMRKFRDIHRAFFFSEYPSSAAYEQHCLTKHEDGEYQFVIPERHRQQLIKANAFVYKQVQVPHEHSLETAFVDADGHFAVCRLMELNRMFVRNLQSATDELATDLQSLMRPQKEVLKYELPFDQVGNINFYHPYDRTRQKLHISPPLTPRSMSPRGHPKQQRLSFSMKDHIRRLQAKEVNTVFTHPRAVTLCTVSQEAQLYQGPATQQWRYFPVGLIFDARQVDLLGEHFIWSRNAVTKAQSWFYKAPNKPHNEVIQLVFAKPPKQSDFQVSEAYSATVLLQALVDKITLDVDLLIEALYPMPWFPTNKLLSDLKDRASHYFAEVREIFKSLREHVGDDLYHQLYEQAETLHQKAHQAYSKEVDKTADRYAMPLDKLAQRLQEELSAEQNEILAGLSKQSVQAVYADRDELFYRLNALKQAIMMKAHYGYDIPIFILPKGASPIHYNERMILKDCRLAFKLIASGHFPFDNRQYSASPFGQDITKAKDRQYQYLLLMELFTPIINQLPEMESPFDGDYQAMSDLFQYALDGQCEDVCQGILESLNLVGREKRELHQVEFCFLHTPEEQIQFFIRQVALGHVSVIKRMIAMGFPITPELIDKAKMVVDSHSEKLASLADLDRDMEMVPIEHEAEIENFAHLIESLQAAYQHASEHAKAIWDEIDKLRIALEAAADETVDTTFTEQDLRVLIHCYQMLNEPPKSDDTAACQFEFWEYIKAYKETVPFFQLLEGHTILNGDEQDEFFELFDMDADMVVALFHLVQTGELALQTIKSYVCVINDCAYKPELAHLLTPIKRLQSQGKKAESARFLGALLALSGELEDELYQGKTTMEWLSEFLHRYGQHGALDNLLVTLSEDGDTLSDIIYFLKIHNEPVFWTPFLHILEHAPDNAVPFIRFLSRLSTHHAIAFDKVIRTYAQHETFVKDLFFALTPVLDNFDMVIMIMRNLEDGLLLPMHIENMRRMQEDLKEHAIRYMTVYHELLLQYPSLSRIEFKYDQSTAYLFKTILAMKERAKGIDMMRVAAQGSQISVWLFQCVDGKNKKNALSEAHLQQVERLAKIKLDKVYDYYRLYHTFHRIQQQQGREQAHKRYRTLFEHMVRHEEHGVIDFLLYLGRHHRSEYVDLVFQLYRTAKGQKFLKQLVHQFQMEDKSIIRQMDFYVHLTKQDPQLINIFNAIIATGEQSLYRLLFRSYDQAITPRFLLQLYQNEQSQPFYLYAAKKIHWQIDLMASYQQIAKKTPLLLGKLHRLVESDNTPLIKLLLIDRQHPKLMGLLADLDEDNEYCRAILCDKDSIEARHFLVLSQCHPLAAKVYISKLKPAESVANRSEPIGRYIRLVRLLHDKGKILSALKQQNLFEWLYRFATDEHLAAVTHLAERHSAVFISNIIRTLASKNDAHLTEHVLRVCQKLSADIPWEHYRPIYIELFKLPQEYLRPLSLCPQPLDAVKLVRFGKVIEGLTSRLEGMRKIGAEGPSNRVARFFRISPQHRQVNEQLQKAYEYLIDKILGRENADGPVDVSVLQLIWKTPTLKIYVDQLEKDIGLDFTDERQRYGASQSA